jgi:hypothetical protein
VAQVHSSSDRHRNSLLTWRPTLRAPGGFKRVLAGGSWSRSPPCSHSHPDITAAPANSAARMALGTTTPAKRGTPSEARRVSAPRDANRLGPILQPGALLTPKMQPAARALQAGSQVGHRPPEQAGQSQRLPPERLAPGQTLEGPARCRWIEAVRYGDDAAEPGSITASKPEDRIRDGGLPVPNS